MRKITVSIDMPIGSIPFQDAFEALRQRVNEYNDNNMFDEAQTLRRILMFAEAGLRRYEEQKAQRMVTE